MIRKKSAEEQIATMHHLINYGVNENTKKTSAPIVETKRLAANGKTYGIIRESTKYYIMEAPQKDTEILAEDFEYIGGFNNRKENEYPSYSKASNALDLKIMSINESVNKDKRVILEQPRVKADWEDKITESMRKEIDRFKTLTTNIDKILTEGEIGKSAGSVPSEHTLPEAPEKNPSDEKVNAPYTENAEAKGDKDPKEANIKHETAGGPYKEKTTSVEKNMQSDKKPNVKTDSEDFTNEKTYEPKNNIASEKPSGGKVVMVNENKGKKIRLKLTEEQVLAWNDNKNFIDTSKGTSVGSSKPYEDKVGKESNQEEANTDPINEGNGESVVYDHPNDQNSPVPGTTDVKTEDGDPYVNKINEEEDIAGFDGVPFPEVEDDDYGTKFDKEYAEFENSQNNGVKGNTNFNTDDDIDDSEAYSDDNLNGVDLDSWNDIDYDDEDYDSDNYGIEDIYEGKRGTLLEFELDLDDDDAEAYDNAGSEEEFTPERANRDIMDILNGVDDDDEYYDDYSLYETKLNAFGKHPAWRKQPMTTPPNKEVAINGAREWDDESVQGEEPYAEKVGDTSPYTEIVKGITESVINSIFGSKKKH